jgi:hypothetical protein
VSTGDNADYRQAMAALLTFVENELGGILETVAAIRKAAKLDGIEPRTEADLCAREGPG